MTVEYVGNGKYVGTLTWPNGKSILYGTDRLDIVMELIHKAFHDYDDPQPTEEDREWTSADWVEDLALREQHYQHKDDDKI